MKSKSDKEKNIKDTEARILEVAEQEFMLKGFAGARTAAIAEKAGVTHAMLHYYFRTKEKIFERIISEKIKMISEIVTPSVEDKTLPLEDMIQSIIDRHLDFISENPNLPRFLIGELMSNPERAEMLKGKIKAFAAPIIQQLQKKIDHYASVGFYRWVDAKDLLLDIMSLNLFPYMASPLINTVFDGIMEDKKSFVEKRKYDNYNTIMGKLKG